MDTYTVQNVFLIRKRALHRKTTFILMKPPKMIWLQDGMFFKIIYTAISIEVFDVLLYLIEEKLVAHLKSVTLKFNSG